MKLMKKAYEEIHNNFGVIFKEIASFFKYNLEKYLSKSTYNNIDSIEDFHDTQYYS